MSYIKQTWANGDVVTASKLNHIEDGIASAGVFAVEATADETTVTLNKTWQEIHDASFAVVRQVLPGIGDTGLWGFVLTCIEAIPPMQNNYTVAVYVIENEGPVTFLTDSSDGYPSLANSGDDSGGGK